MARLALAAFIVYWVVNLALISAVLAADSGQNLFKLISGQRPADDVAVRVDGVGRPACSSSSGSARLRLSIALVGPLLAIALYQRSTFAALKAMRLALTDPLTGLGNHRHFHERLQRELDAGRARRGGDQRSASSTSTTSSASTTGSATRWVTRVLGQIAARLRQGGEAFRLGGDEFAVLLPGLGEREAVAVARSIVERVAARRLEGIDEVTVSGGVAHLPGAGRRAATS